ncbi:MFS transporter [Kocuria sp. JC486]|uniref:MFS transporter n=1 Tax=Kocuria sp. JC486 TaxID=1970736 RepID=UPI0014249AD6|nr:MFS transporter [Kocuria sp. JC486]
MDTGSSRAAGAAQRAVRRAFAPFGYSGYPRLAVAMLSMVLGQGTWALSTVFQVMHDGGDPVALSTVTAIGSCGLIVFALLGGVAADRLPPHRVLLGVSLTLTVVVSTVSVLSATGVLTTWQLAGAAFLIFAGVGMFYPSYSASLPRLLPPDKLLAANGVEGSARPLLQTAAGPAVAGFLAAAWGPWSGFAAVAVCGVISVVTLLGLEVPELEHQDSGSGQDDANPAGPDTGSVKISGIGVEAVGAPVEPAAAPSGAFAKVLSDLKEGVGYTIRTPWLLGTLLFAVVAIFFFLGPLEVLLPFVVRDALGGGEAEFGLLLAVTGTASAVGAMTTAGLPYPRRYLTVIVLVWGFGTLPLAFVGFTESWAVMVLILLVVGASDGIGQVLWGTLLQRRVPGRMLGRVSSLDFFVSLLLLPASMAVAGPLSVVVPIPVIFVIAATVPAVAAVVVWWVARMGRDELTNPLRS